MPSPKARARPAPRSSSSACPSSCPTEIAKAAHYKLDQEAPIATVEELPEYDAIIFGTPTRYGNMTAQMKNFLDQTGGLWAQGKLVGKVGSVFTSTATQHGGQESTILTFLPVLLHHGMVIVGLPYSFQGQMGVDEITRRLALRRLHDRGRRRLAPAERRSNSTAPASRASTWPRSRRSSLRSKNPDVVQHASLPLRCGRAFRRSLIASPRPVFRDRRDRDGRSARGVEAAQGGEEAGGGLDEVAVWAEIQGRASGASEPGRAACAPNSSAASPGSTARRVQAHLRARRVMRGEHARARAGSVAALRLRRPAAWPSSASIASRGTPPGRSRRGVPPRQATMVDSTPTWVGAAVEHRVDAPVEIGQHMVRIGRADAARAVGRGRGDRAAGRCRSAWARGWAGTRRPTLSRPARARSETVQVGGDRHDERQRPGPERLRQRRRRRRRRRPARARPSEARARWAISGLKLGPLLGGIDRRRPPRASVASAPRP